MILFDFRCVDCDTVTEGLVARGCEQITCECGGSANRMPCAPHMFQEIVPTTLTSKKYKAGYVHSHGNRPKTPGKIQVSVP